MIAPLRRAARRALPESLSVAIALWRRAKRDRKSGDAGRMVAPQSPRADMARMMEAVRVAQPIHRSALWEGKMQNLRLAAAALSGVAVPPGAIFSFWTLLGPPLAARGYAAGRAIRAGRLQAGTGGGLCQISGLVYELGLRSGLSILERHPHSLDLYDEATRFTPLGLDATIVWGHKDLRLRNDGAKTVVFAFEVDDEAILGRVLSPSAMALARLEIKRADDGEGLRHVEVSRRLPCGREELVSRDRYA